MLPLDVYLENELEIVQKASGLVEDLTETVGYKLLKSDPESKIVVNFHGVSFLHMSIAFLFFDIMFHNLFFLRTYSFTLDHPASVCSNQLSERWPRSPRVPHLNLPLPIGNPPLSSPNMRLPRLRALNPQ